VTNVSELKEALKPQLSVVPTGRTDAPELSVEQAKKGLRLSSRGRTLLRADSEEGEDRSARLFELAALLREGGVSEDATFVLIRNSIWNKFQGRDDEVERLWEAVERSRIDDDSRGELLRRFSVGRGEPESLSDFTERDIDPPSWLVKGVLQRGGLHFVAAPKKCYKSTFVTDLGLSLVSGNEFLGAMPVDQQASVLMIQEENPESLQQLRMRAMLRGKGVSLHGSAPVKNGGEGSYIFDFSSAPFWLVNRSGLKLCYKEDRQVIENWIKRKHIEVLILDPLYILAGCEISYGKDVLEILDWFLRLKDDLGVTVLVVHHMKKLPEELPQDLSQLMFGSSYFANAYDGAVVLMPQYSPGSMIIEKVHAVRDYRAWREGSFDFSIYLEEDGSEYIVQLDQGHKHFHPLVHLVRKQPGITLTEAANVLGLAKSSVSERATKLGLRKVREAPKGGGRPQTRFFPE
jgi:hypothetical protein